MTVSIPSTRSSAGRLYRAKAIIDGALSNPDICALLANYGYHTAELMRGKALYDKALELHRIQRYAYNERSTTPNPIKVTWKLAEDRYKPLFKIAQIALKEHPQLWDLLDLTGMRQKNLLGWIAQVRQFYTNALAHPDVLPLLARFDISRARLEAGFALLQELDTLRLNYSSQPVSVEALNTMRNSMIDELEHWLADFIAVSKIALVKKPKLLKQLGLRK